MLEEELLGGATGLKGVRGNGSCRVYLGVEGLGFRAYAQHETFQPPNLKYWEGFRV